MGIKIFEIKLAQQTAGKPLFLRTWSTSFNNFADNQHLQDALVEYTAQGTNLSVNALAPVANSILVPNTKIGQLANIGGDYNDSRFSIQITIEITDSQMMTSYEVITGYTDHLGYSMLSSDNVNIDDNMIIFINGVADLNKENHGGSSYWTIGNITQVLSPVTGVMNGEAVVDTNMVTCRPADTISLMASKVLSGQSSRTTVSTMLMTAANKRSHRENNVAANYLSKTIGSYRDQMIDNGGDEEGAMLNAAANPSIADPATTASAFLRELRYQTGYNQERSITWGELRKLDGTLTNRDQRIKTILLKPNAVDTQLAIVGGAENWNSAYNETVIAQQALTAIPAYMSVRLIGELDIEAHNATTTGEVVVNIFSVRGMRQDIDMVTQEKTIRQSFASAVFQQLLQGMPGRTLYIRAQMGMVGVATIMVEVDGGGKRPYSASLYNDASYSPCLGDNHLSLANLSQELDVICATATNRALGAMTDMAQVISGTHNNGGAILQPNGSSDPITSPKIGIIGGNDTPSIGSGGFNFNNITPLNF